MRLWSVVPQRRGYPSGYLGDDVALPGCVWSEIPPRFCLKRKNKPFNFLACFCHNVFQVILIFLVFFSPPKPRAVCGGGGKAGWVGCGEGLEVPVRDVQHPEGINEPLTMPSLLRSSVEKMLSVLCVLFACVYQLFI